MLMLPSSFIYATLGRGQLVPSTVHAPCEFDLESCFKLFTLPHSSDFPFSEPVVASVFGGAPGEDTFFAMRAVSMGWVNSVALPPNFLRRLVFQDSKISFQ